MAAIHAFLVINTVLLVLIAAKTGAFGVLTKITLTGLAIILSGTALVVAGGWLFGWWGAVPATLLLGLAISRYEDWYAQRERRKRAECDKLDRPDSL